MQKLGLKKGTVIIRPYDLSWSRSYVLEEKKIRKALGSKIRSIEHIGSTAVPGLDAKPIIDILVGVESLKKMASSVTKALEACGYIYRPKLGRKDQHLYFRKGDEVVRTHYLHLVKYRGVIWKKRLLFRDYLRTHPLRAKQYANLKEKLAKQFPTERNIYTKKKEAFIHQTVEIAQKMLKI